MEREAAEALVAALEKFVVATVRAMHVDPNTTNGRSALARKFAAINHLVSDLLIVIEQEKL